MTSLLRESAIGQILNFVSRGRILPYPEQRPGFIVPAKYLKEVTSPTATLNDFPRSATVASAEKEAGRTANPDVEKAIREGEPVPEAVIEQYRYLVEFEEGDPENPR
jgi:DHA1 family multidrug resistance protein-like MFS transporter